MSLEEGGQWEEEEERVNGVGWGLRKQMYIYLQLHEHENVIIKMSKKVKRGTGIIRKLENKVSTLKANTWLA